MAGRQPGHRKLARLAAGLAAAETAAATETTAAAKSAAGTITAAAAARTAASRCATLTWLQHLGLARQQAFALQLLARQLPRPADRFGALACALLGRFFVMAAKLHFAENALALHLL